MRFVAGRGAMVAKLLLAWGRHWAGRCWQGRRDRAAAGRGAVAERLVRGTAVAERHREDVAYCGTADAEPAGRLAGAPLRSKCAAARLRHGTGVAAEQERWHRARAPLRSRGAGRKQELTRGVRS